MGRERLYVGELSNRTTEEELRDLFGRYGRLRTMDLKPNGGFAFVEFEEERDADDAMRALDAKDFMGRRLRVEVSRPSVRREPVMGAGGAPRGYDDRGGYDYRDRGYDARDRGYDARDRGYDARDRGYDNRDRGYDARDRGYDARDRGYDNRDRGYDYRDRGYDARDRGYDARDRGYDRGYERPAAVPKTAIPRTQFRLIAIGLPADSVWQDLKDFGRGAGQVNYTAVKFDAALGTTVGVLEYATEADYRNALTTLNGQQCKGCTVTIEEETAANAFNPRYHQGRAAAAPAAREDRGRDRSRSRERGGRDRSRSRERHDRGAGGEGDGHHHQQHDHEHDQQHRHAHDDAAPADGGAPPAGGDAAYDGGAPAPAGDEYARGE